MWHCAFAPSTWSNWALVIVGIGAVIAAIITLRTLNQQTIAATKAAEALVSSERAWVVVELIPLAIRFSDGQWYRTGGVRVPLNTEEIVRGEHLRYELKVTNMGRTPAHIFAFHILYQCLEDGVRDLPENVGSHLAEAREFEHIIAGSDSFQISEPIIDVQLNARDSWDAISRFEKTVVVSGWVKYRHMFSETDDFYAPFCYSYHASQAKLTRVGRYSTQEEQRKNDLNFPRKGAQK
jgi:hypothetical protein